MRSLLQRRRRAGSVLGIALAALVLLSACGDDDDSDDARSNDATTTTAAPTTSTTSTTAASGAGGGEASGGESAGGTGAGCAATATGGTPAGAATAPAIDVDGDGRDDTAWLSGIAGDGERTFGITTASGATFSTPFSSASPIAATALAFAPDGELPAYVLISDGRIGSLWLVADCAITRVTNPQGDQYTFDLGGFTGYGTGVGCIDADGDGTRDLVGLLAESADPSTTHITRTVIELDGARASNGPSDELTARSPQDDAEIESARTVSCGDLTLDANGVHEPE
jgi:hypothetical protein